ncbi:Lethal giant larvae protein-like protein SRO77 [Golovinomyces cichoracearum]|uniref:Lethal giant larvae protein-like protein SRO77 n=1 Tax=Golovinomyces cichoracearum TaxID=62708 RepID=A0A420ICS1_9PEZI|nr:Lethal giant larvae protein-like protein SRO77 [Golovinomyces cichoracearum]
MATFIRGIQVGIQKNLSSSILPEYLAPDDQTRFGINSQISCLAYDPVQSLLAVGTNESKFGSGQIYVFGQQRIQFTFKLTRKASIKLIQFCANRLISLDSKNQLIIWDLVARRKLASTIPPGIVTTIVTDPTIDWALIGLQNGRVIAFDLDRELWAPLRLPNFWQEKTKRPMPSPIVSMQLHPRDIGQLLIGYTEGAVLYSFKLNKPMKYFEYIDSAQSSNVPRKQTDTVKKEKPNLTQVFWHPGGIFFGTAYDDSTLVFWDSKDGRILNVNSAIGTKNIESKETQLYDRKLSKGPFCKISWCCKENSDETELLFAGGSSLKGLTLLELGATPIYATANWQTLTNFFEGKHQFELSIPPDAEVKDFCLIPKKFPHYAGAQDPIALLILLTSGELVTLSYPDGYLISPTNQLHPSILFVHPFVTFMNVCNVSRTRWLGMIEKRLHGPSLIRGGSESIKPLKVSGDRDIIMVAHGDGTIRIWDSGQLDQLENSNVLQVDIARALGIYKNVTVTSIDMASHTGEMVVGTATGKILFYCYGKNRIYDREPSQCIDIPVDKIIDISSRCEPTLEEGLQPKYLYNMAQEPITAVKMSNIGFLGVGAESGKLSIIDLRGPTVIFSSMLSELIKPSNRSNFIKIKSISSPAPQDWPVLIEFGVLNLDGDNYSSISCFVGTFLGNVMTFKILPGEGGIYTTQYIGTSSLADKVISITPIISESGKRAEANGETVRALRSGQQTHGFLVAVSQTEIRIFKPSTAKGTHKNIGSYFCEAANVIEFEDSGCALVAIFGDATIRAFSLPGLKEINSAKLTAFETYDISASVLTQAGSIFGWTGPSELAMMSVWGTGKPLPPNGDHLFNQELIIPARPTISNIDWITGTQFISPNDLDLLIGGPDRPPSRRKPRTADETQNFKNDSQKEGGNESWGDYMARQINERTEKLDIVGDSMNKIQENSQSWADDINKFVKKQKKSVILGAVTSKLF